jgi:hypothetical protein
MNSNIFLAKITAHCTTHTSYCIVDFDWTIHLSNQEVRHTTSAGRHHRQAVSQKAPPNIFFFQKRTQSNRQHMIMEPPLYQKLQEEDSIRLLILEPGNHNSPISCRLEEVRLSAKPIYKAVSYTWGEPALSHSICINGRPMRVRYNLFMALLYLRHMSHTQTLWIDALSINQDDISERNQQVRIMGQIYKDSQLTVVWLREEEEESDSHALNLLHLCDVLAKDNSLAMEAKCLRISDSFFKDDPANTDNIISSLCGILNSNWFGRLWILQEFALSSQVIICCGDKEFVPEGLELLALFWRQA